MASLHAFRNDRAPAPWQREWAAAITTPEALLARLGLDASLLGPAYEAARLFPLRVPEAYVARMRHGDPDDPLLRQVLPAGDELVQAPGFVSDPLGERTAMRAGGLLQKYRGRALMITTAACAVHCRYCFRREFPYADATADGPRWSAALAAIAEDPSIEEVLLSGGDPLSLATHRLQMLTRSLSSIAHLKRLRIHTRLPVVLPARVDQDLIGWLRDLPCPTVVVLHANHPNEIDESVRDACARLRGAGVTLLNQSVLLRGVNDDAGVLARLSEALFRAGVLPYYLHLLDKVRGAAHFEVEEPRALAIARELASRLPGYLVPRLAREVEGAPAKVVLAPDL